MNISIDGRAAFFYTGTGIGNYSHQLIKNIFKMNRKHSIDIYSLPLTNNNKNNLSFWKFQI